MALDDVQIDYSVDDGQTWTWLEPGLLNAKCQGYSGIVSNGEGVIIASDVEGMRYCGFRLLSDVSSAQAKADDKYAETPKVRFAKKDLVEHL